MNPIGFTAVQGSHGIAPSHPRAPRSQSWSHLPASAPTQPNAVVPRKEPRPSVPRGGHGDILRVTRRNFSARR